jgi:hypothetical protein
MWQEVLISATLRALSHLSPFAVQLEGLRTLYPFKRYAVQCMLDPDPRGWLGHVIHVPAALLVARMTRRCSCGRLRICSGMGGIWARTS